ncbi:PIN domain-containing protein [Acidithiobacillus sp. IBUN Pt1247-S3]|uniref:PIN domain-containing protein n=1 Tax=Acidithiobacillus sp. IBUN Pt1247-S3 TaxID=3166642 RepID=UPI0034E4E057
MSLVDANVVLRYLLDDHPELSARASEILEQHSVTLLIEVACEVVYVLQKVYGIDRGEIKAQLSNLLLEGLVHMDRPERFLSALRLYSSSKLDFVDTLLWASHTVDQEEIYTFDAKLQKSLQPNSQEKS